MTVYGKSKMAKHGRHTVWEITQKIWNDRSVVECLSVMTTVFYSWSQRSLCVTEPSWPSKKTQFSLQMQIDYKSNSLDLTKYARTDPKPYARLGYVPQNCKNYSSWCCSRFGEKKNSHIFQFTVKKNGYLQSNSECMSFQ